MRKVKNVVIKLKNTTLKYCSLVNFGHNLYDAEKIALNFALLNSECLALTFWKSRLSEITDLIYERPENPELQELATDLLSLQEL